MINTTSSKKLLVLIFLMFSFLGNAQVAGTHFTVTLANVTSTSNTMEFDVMLTVDGTGAAATGVKLSAMQVGVNYNTAIVNGGTLTLTYAGGKSAAIAGLVNNSLNAVTAGHLRVGATALTIDNSFDVVNGTYTFGRYRVTKTANWTPSSNAQLWLQPNNIGGKTNTAVNAFPYGATLGALSYSYNSTSPAGTPGVALGYTQVSPLTAMLNVPICATAASQTASSGVTCFGGNNGSSTITVSPVPTVSAITYTVDGGASQSATLVNGVFTISGLTAGIHAVVISNTGCSDVAATGVSVSGPNQLTNTSTVSSCDSYTWSVTGLTYTASGAYTGTTTNGDGCTVNETLNLTITQSTSSSTTVSACDTYTWLVNGLTYTATGTYVSVVGCHTATLNLTITPSTTNSATVSVCDAYTWLVNGLTYTVSGTYVSVVGCHRETLNLTINTAATPTGLSTQTVSVTNLNDATLEDLVVSPTTVIWYATLADAQNQVNPLLITTVLTDGATYYAVNVSSGCASAPFAVTVTVALGVNGFDGASLSVYPNPTSGIVNINYSEAIVSVTVMNLLGQVILQKKPNQSEVNIDLSSLPSATYFVIVESNGNWKVVKVIKND